MPSWGRPWGGGIRPSLHELTAGREHRKRLARGPAGALLGLPPMPGSRARTAYHCGKYYEGYGRSILLGDCMTASGVCMPHRSRRDRSVAGRSARPTGGRNAARNGARPSAGRRRARDAGGSPSRRGSANAAGKSIRAGARSFVRTPAWARAGSGARRWRWSAGGRSARPGRAGSSPKQCEAMSRRMTGTKMPEDTCRKLSLRMKGNVPWNKGKKGLQVAWNKGQSNWWAKGEKNNNWKGGVTPRTRHFARRWNTPRGGRRCSSVTTGPVRTAGSGGASGGRSHQAVLPLPRPPSGPRQRPDALQAVPRRDRAGIPSVRQTRGKRKTGPTVGPAVA